MPFNHPTRSNIINRAIDQDLRKKTKSRSRVESFSEANVIAQPVRIKIIAAETIQPGTACYTDSNGLHRSGNDVATQIPATCVALNAGIVNEEIALAYDNELVTCEGASFTADMNVYLSTGTPNLTTTPPLFGTSGKYIQKVGFAVNSNQFYVELNDYYEIK